MKKVSNLAKYKAIIEDQEIFIKHHKEHIIELERRNKELKLHVTQLEDKLTESYEEIMDFKRRITSMLT